MSIVTKTIVVGDTKFTVVFEDTATDIKITADAEHNTTGEVLFEGVGGGRPKCPR